MVFVPSHVFFNKMLTLNHQFFWGAKFDSSPLNSYLPNRKYHLPTIHFQVWTVKLCGCSFPIDAPVKETTKCFKNMMEKMLGTFSETIYIWLKTSSFPHHHRVSYHQTPRKAKVQRLFRWVGGRSCRVCAAFDRELSGSLSGHFLWWMWLKYPSPSFFSRALKNGIGFEVYIGWTCWFFKGKIHRTLLNVLVFLFIW